MPAAQPPQSAVTFGGVNPVFRVKNIAASLGYYQRALGFTLDWPANDFFASVGRGNTHIFLCVGDQGHPGAWVWIGVNDVETLREEYRASGAKIRHEPTNYPWALEMQVEDPDGNILRIGSEPKYGEPQGEWLDMYGKKWAPPQRKIVDKCE